MLIPEDIYQVVKQAMPIPCVDLVALDQVGRVLLVKRANHPARGEWWFPGGRVHFLESREAAALRKLREECNLSVTAVTEFGTRDIIIAAAENAPPSHGITTLFRVEVQDTSSLRLDPQSDAAEWHTPREWLNMTLHPFVAAVLHRISEHEISEKNSGPETR